MAHRTHTIRPSPFDPPLEPEEAMEPAPAAPRPLFPFRATIDIAEMDERGRPAVRWAGKTREISRSQLVFLSRRMCYETRHIVVAVHLIDDRPVALYGSVMKSDYDGDGLYRTTLALEPLPHGDAFQAWLSSLHPRT